MKWIFGTLALLVLGLVLKLSLLVYAMYVLLGILALSRFFSRTWTNELEASRFCGRDVLEIGGSADVSVEVINQGRLSVPWLIVEDSLPRDALVQVPRHLKADGPRLKLTRLAPGETTSLQYQVTFLMRGYYQIGPLLLETGDVFGLHRRFRVATEPHFAMVLPKVRPLEGYNLASRRPIGEIRVVHRLFEDPTRLAGIRPYQPGDPLNRIHWRATARTGQLHSRIYENSRVAGATFLLDFHGQSYRGPGAANSAELGTFYGSLGQYEKAISALQEAIRLKPDDADPWVNLGTFYSSLGQYDEEVSALQEAIRLKPEPARRSNRCRRKRPPTFPRHRFEQKAKCQAWCADSESRGRGTCPSASSCPAAAPPT